MGIMGIYKKKNKPVNKTKMCLNTWSYMSEIVISFAAALISLLSFVYRIRENYIDIVLRGKTQPTDRIHIEPNSQNNLRIFSLYWLFSDFNFIKQNLILYMLLKIGYKDLLYKLAQIDSKLIKNTHLRQVNDLTSKLRRFQTFSHLDQLYTLMKILEIDCRNNWNEFKKILKSSDYDDFSFDDIIKIGYEYCLMATDNNYDFDEIFLRLGLLSHLFYCDPKLSYMVHEYSTRQNTWTSNPSDSKVFEKIICCIHYGKIDIDTLKQQNVSLEQTFNEKNTPNLTDKTNQLLIQCCRKTVARKIPLRNVKILKKLDVSIFSNDNVEMMILYSFVSFRLLVVFENDLAKEDKEEFQFLLFLDIFLRDNIQTSEDVLFLESFLDGEDSNSKNADLKRELEFYLKKNFFDSKDDWSDLKTVYDKLISRYVFYWERFMLENRIYKGLITVLVESVFIRRNLEKKGVKKGFNSTSIYWGKEFNKSRLGDKENFQSMETFYHKLNAIEINFIDKLKNLFKEYFERYDE